MHDLNMAQYLEVYGFENKKRFGNLGDGGYVIGILEGDYDCYISAGIGEDESFTRDFLNYYDSLNIQNTYGFDGTIEDYLWEYTKEIQFYKKNIRFYNDVNNTNLKDIIKSHNNIFIQMDIENYEYEWLLSLESEELAKIKQIVIEFHGTGGGHTNEVDSQYSDSIITYQDKIKALKKLSASHYIIHAHGNVFGKLNYYENSIAIPDVLELTLVNKNYFRKPPSFNTISFPIPGLDYPNTEYYIEYSTVAKAVENGFYYLANDYILEDYPFVTRI